MSKERKFHEWIEEQDREEKDRVWAKLQQKEAERLAAQEKTESAPVVSKPKRFVWRKWMKAAANSLAFVFLGVFALVKFLPSDSNGTKGGEEPKDRYFTEKAYDTVETENTLQGYAQEIGQKLLYFDWYAETDHLRNYAWQLKDTKEIICYSEEMVDIETGCMISVFVLEANTNIEVLLFEQSSANKSEVEGTSVSWTFDDDKAWANFAYEGYKYYLRVEEPIDESYVLSLVEELLP